jgi:hypothetical protein
VPGLEPALGADQAHQLIVADGGELAVFAGGVLGGRGQQDRGGGLVQDHALPEPGGGTAVAAGQRTHAGQVRVPVPEPRRDPPGDPRRLDRGVRRGLRVHHRQGLVVQVRGPGAGVLRVGVEPGVLAPRALGGGAGPARLHLLLARPVFLRCHAPPPVGLVIFCGGDLPCSFLLFEHRLAYGCVLQVENHDFFVNDLQHAPIRPEM